VPVNLVKQQLLAIGIAAAEELQAHFALIGDCWPGMGVKIIDNQRGRRQEMF
jgi:hypothetical protein